MVDRIRRIEEKVQLVLTALDHINVEAALRDDLKEVKKALLD